MEAKKTKELIKDAIASETKSARENWGETYHSEHESWAVLKEEIEEAGEEFNKCTMILASLWHYVRTNKKKSEDKQHIIDLLHYLQDHAKSLATESIQIAAVAQKYIDTVEAIIKPEVNENDKSVQENNGEKDCI